MQIKLDVIVSRQLLFDTFVTAMKGGIGYFAVASEYKWQKPGTDGEEDLENFRAVVSDAEAEEDEDGDFKDKVIDKAVIEKGFEKIINDDNLKISSDIRRKVALAMIEPENADLDANDVDCIVQVGLFGELVYA